MAVRTKQLSRVINVGTTPQDAFGPNRRRKAFIISPVAGGGSPVVAVPFTGTGAVQPWTVPAGVTSLLDIYVFGAGGNNGASGAVLGGAGGSGGGFANSGPLTVVPGSVLTVSPDTGGNQGLSSVVSASHVVYCEATSATNSTLDVPGAAGIGTIGIQLLPGGTGAAATLLAGGGGGGGGAAGAFGAGQSGNGQSPGVGGGGPVIATYGTGGAGAAGQASGAVGLQGFLWGGGAGGPGALGGNPMGGGANGGAVIFYAISQAISLAPGASVVVGEGALNYLPGQTFPTVIDDEQLGTIIREPWSIVSGTPNVLVTILEILYECEQDDWSH